MATFSVEVENGGDLLHAVQEALRNLESAGGEVIIDFSSVRRIDAEALRALEALALAAGQKAVKVVLRGVGVEVYKVLTLMNLAPRFSYQG